MSKLCPECEIETVLCPGCNVHRPAEEFDPIMMLCRFCKIKVQVETKPKDYNDFLKEASERETDSAYHRRGEKSKRQRI